MASVSYWVRVGVRVDGPFTIGALRAKARTGALTRIALLSEDKSKWMVASRLRALFNEDGTVNTSAVVDEVKDEEECAWPHDGDADSVPPFAVSLPSVARVRAEWVLVPAWTVALVAALLPVIRVNGQGLCAWEVGAIASADGWRGTVAASSWLVLIVAALVGVAGACVLHDSRRGAMNLRVAGLAVLCACAGFSTGPARGIASVLGLVIASLSAACIVTIVQGGGTLGRRGDQATLPTAAATAFAALGIVAILVMFLAVAVKGPIFLVPGFFVLVAGGAIAVGGILAGDEAPKRRAALILVIVALAAAVLSVLAEGITVTAVGGPRMATFDAVRALTVVAMSCIGAYLGEREVRESRVPTSDMTLDATTHTEEPSDGQDTK